MTNPNANPGGGDPENTDDDGKKKSESEDFVPASRLKAALKDQSETHAAEMADLKTGFEQRLSKLEKPAEKDVEVFTRAELRQLVADGHITQDQADLKWDKQQEAKFKKEAVSVSKGVVQDAQLTQRVEQDIARYVALEPDINVKGSDLRKKITKEFQELVRLGDPSDSLITECKAIRAALGPIDSLELARKGRSGHDHHEEINSGENGGDGPKGKQFQDSLTERKRKYYQKQIDNGIYKSWDEVKEELKFSKEAA